VLRELVELGSAALQAEVVALCQTAYGEDLTELVRSMRDAVHVYIRDERAMVSHAMWGTRWLQTDGGPLLRTAYVEAVATHPDHRNLGLASRVMRRLVAEIPPEFEVAALAPATIPLYARLGWRPWLGPLSVRMPDGSSSPTPDEVVMVYDLVGRPPLEIGRALSVEWRVGEVW
jgi:aminoglycoside 2'-N-acetyltransferase I